MPKKKTSAPDKARRGRPSNRRKTPLGLFLAAARERSGKTQQQVADAMGVVPSRVADLEAGRRDLVTAYLDQRDALERTAAAYGVTVDELLAAGTPQ